MFVCFKVMHVCVFVLMSVILKLTSSDSSTIKCIQIMKKYLLGVQQREKAFEFFIVLPKSIFLIFNVLILFYKLRILVCSFSEFCFRYWNVNMHIWTLKFQLEFTECQFK